jgi:hypothetical protein
MAEKKNAAKGKDNKRPATGSKPGATPRGRPPKAK